MDQMPSTSAGFGHISLVAWSRMSCSDLAERSWSLKRSIVPGVMISRSTRSTKTSRLTRSCASTTALQRLRDQRSTHPDALERAVQECQLRQAFLVDARKIRRARGEYNESRERLPDAARERFVLVTWQELYGRLLKPEWSRRRWAADLRTYLEECGLASFQGIKRDVADARPAHAPFGMAPGAHSAYGPIVRNRRCSLELSEPRRVTSLAPVRHAT